MSLDGQRFLMLGLAEGVAGDSAAAAPSLTLVQHWFEELRRLVPTD